MWVDKREGEHLTACETFIFIEPVAVKMSEHTISEGERAMIIGANSFGIRIDKHSSSSRSHRLQLVILCLSEEEKNPESATPMRDVTISIRERMAMSQLCCQV